MLFMGIRLAAPDSVEAQMVDTLSYFDPDSLEPAIYTGNVIDLAVRFQVTTGWQRFGIRELGILTPGPQTAHPGDWLYICSANDSNEPGSVIDSVRIVMEDNPDSSLKWTVIDLSGVVSLQGMTGDFWVRGPALFFCQIDMSTPSGHSFIHSIILGQPQWGSAKDISLRAVAQDQSDSLAWLEYFPHHVGDKWLYRYTGFTEGVEKYVMVEVIGDTLMDNGRHYWHFGGWDGTTESYRSQFFRIDTIAQRVYEYSGFVDTSLCPNREVLRFDFSSQIPYDSTMGCGCRGYYPCDTLYYAPGCICRESGQAPIGIDTISAPYYSFISQGMIYYENTYSHGFGLIKSVSYEILIITGALISAEIDGIHYGEPFATQPQQDLPVDYRLGDPYPNPFNSEQEIQYVVGSMADVELAVYDLLGRKVKVLVSEVQPPGSYRVVWQGFSDLGKALPSGLYFYRLIVTDSAGMVDLSRKLVLLK